MKNLFLGTVLTVVFLIALESRASAQGMGLEYKRKTSNSELVITWSGGYWGSGYGYGYASGYGTGAGCSAGTSYLYRGIPARIYGTPYSLRPRMSYDAYFYGSRPVYNYAPVWSTPGRSSERMTRIMVQKDMEEGLRFFRKGNYPGALSSFKKAYLGDTDSSAVQFHFALALAGAGDFRNADRAFSAALEGLSVDDIRGTDLSGMFGSSAQQDLYRKNLAMAAPDSLSSGVIALLLGDDPAAREILSAQKKNAAARKLLRSLIP